MATAPSEAGVYLVLGHKVKSTKSEQGDSE